jgi:LuxR family maltose regulon positive regulatory protein
LLSDALRRRLVRQAPQHVPLLHRRASRWFARERLWPEAVRHALVAGDIEQAAQWAENCAMEMLERGDHHRLQGWIGKLPPDVIRGRRRLRLASAWAFAVSFETARASSEISAIAQDVERMQQDDPAVVTEAEWVELDAVSALIASIGDDSERALELGSAVGASTVPVPQWARHFAQSAQIFGLIYRGQFNQISRTWKAAADQIQHGQTPNYSDMLRDAVYGLAALVYGELPDAKRIFEATLQRAQGILGESAAGVAALAGCLASIYYECNELSKARKMIAGRMPVMLETAPLAALIRCTVCASRVLRRDGDKGAALAVLEDGRQAAIARRWLRLKLACDAETVRQLLADGRIAEARQIADELSATVPMMCEGRRGSAMETWTSYCVLQARVLLAENAAERAIDFLSRLLENLVAMGWRYAESSVSLLLALAHEQLGASEDALAALKSALRIGNKIGMVNGFVDEGPMVRALLQRARRASSEFPAAEAAYIDTLLSAFDQLNKTPPAPPRYAQMKTMSAALSARELEILSHVARGLSNKEIGRQLNLAPETVKWHMKNVFEKLNVSSRFEAVQSAFGVEPEGRGGLA